MQPFISIILPVRNEDRYIERALYSIAAQDYPRSRIEALVVDGRSTDRTREMVSRFAAESTLDVLLIDNPRYMPAAAMNIGLAHARGDIIIRLDGHASLAPDYLSRCVEALDDTGADCVGGVLRNDGDTYIGRAIAIAMSSRFGVGGASFRSGGRGPTDTVAFGAYRRDVFDRIGNFTEDIDKGEDDEFNYRLLDAGGSIMLVPEIRASYTVRGSLRALWRQYFGYGMAKPQVLRRHPAQARPRQLAPAAFALSAVATSAAASIGHARPLAALGTVYTLAATIASLVLAARHGWRYLPPLPLIFLCLHLSYGLGFLAGTVGLAGWPSRSARSGAHQSTEAPK